MTKKQKYIISMATEKDAEQIVHYLDHIGKEAQNLNFGVGQFKYTVEEERSFLRNLTNGVMLIARNLEGDMIAESTCFAKSQRTLHVYTIGLSVKQDYWGMGIGTGLIKRQMDECKRIGCRKMMMYVDTLNNRAIELYERLGFFSEGLMKKDGFVNGLYRDTLIMSKFLVEIPDSQSAH